MSERRLLEKAYKMGAGWEILGEKYTRTRDKVVVECLAMAQETMEAFAPSDVLHEWHCMVEELVGTAYPKRLVRDRVSRQLPTEPGFYWWRENEWQPWRMINVVHFASGPIDPWHLMTYDVENVIWGAVTVAGWKQKNRPIGEWVRCDRPDAHALAEERSDDSQQRVGGKDER